MKAVLYERHGGIDELLVGDMPVPDPASGEALVRSRACGLNGFDPMSHPDVPDAAVVPVPHTLNGAVPAAMVALAAGSATTAEMPLTGVGKVDRAAILDALEGARSGAK